MRRCCASYSTPIHTACALPLRASSASLPNPPPTHTSSANFSSQTSTACLIRCWPVSNHSFLADRSLLRVYAQTGPRCGTGPLTPHPMKRRGRSTFTTSRCVGHLGLFSRQRRHPEHSPLAARSRRWLTGRCVGELWECTAQRGRVRCARLLRSATSADDDERVHRLLVPPPSYARRRGQGTPPPHHPSTAESLCILIDANTDGCGVVPRGH